MNLFRLDGKTAIVTGGTGLYGKAVSKALAEAGAQVVIASRNLENCETYADFLQKEGYKADGFHLDMADEKNIREFVKKVNDRYGRIDILINNAVRRNGVKDLEDVTKADLEQSQLVNYTGLILVTKEVIKLMRKQKSGNIINIGSIQGVVGPHFPVYGSTGMSSGVNYTFEKWGMVGFTKWIANYYGRFNIRANCISPGGFGPGVEKAFGENEFVHNYRKLTPLGRFATEEDIKGPVIFLSSEASSYITGHNLMMDGGWTSW